MGSRGRGTVVRVVSAVSLVLGAMGGAAVAGAGAASSSTSSPGSAANQPFHPVQGDQAFARLRGKGYAKALGTARQRAAALPRAATSVGSTSTAWTALGPKPEFGSTSGFSYGGNNSGRITGLALGSTGSIYAASAGGGVWSSTNDGTSWTTTTDTQPNIAMGAVAVDPTNPQYIFAGTGEDNSCLDCFFGSGIMESTDGGSSWTTSNPSGMFSGVVVSSIVVVPGATPTSPPAQVLVGTSSDLFVSTDAGSTWTAESGAAGWSGGNVTSMVVDRATPALNIYAFVSNVGIERSTDGGANWTTVKALATTTNGALAIAPASSTAATTLYVSAGSGSGYVGMYKSTDGGTNWSAVTVPAYTGQNYAYDGTTGDAGDQSWYDNAIAIDPAHPNIVVAGGITAVVTTDGGTNWSNLNGGGFFSSGVKRFHPDFHAVVFNSAGDLYLGNDGGVWKLPAANVNTTPPTLTFTNLNSNLNITQFYAGVAQSGNASQILAGAQDNGSDLYSTSAATPTTWNEVGSGDGGFTAIDPNSPSIQYAEQNVSLGGSIIRTTNGWTSGAGFTQHAAPFAQSNWAAPLVTVPGTAGGNPGGTYSTVLIGGDAVYKSTDGAASWAALGALTSHVGSGPFSDVSAIAVAPSNSSVIYAGFDDGTVQMSSDGGATWTLLNTGQSSSLAVTHISVSASDRFTVYVSLANTYNGFPEQSSGPNVIVGSALNGTPVWTDVSSNLPTGVPTNSVISDGATGLIVANDTGVFSAPTLNGASTVWSRIGTGLPNVQVMDVVLTPGGILIVDTHGRGAWSIPFSTAADGSGTMTVLPTSAPAGSSGNTLTFTYTAAAGGLASGEIDVAVPAGWSGSSTTTSAPGYTTSTCGSVAAPGSAINVTGVTLTSGATCTITYGSRASGGSGATAPSSPGTSIFTTTEKSTSGGALTALAASPSVTLTNAADGTGTLTVLPTSVMTGSSGNTLIFTYTAAPGGLSSGEIDVAVPADWSAPSTTGADAGYTTSTCGTGAVVSGPTIAVTGVTLAGGATCTIVYGSMASGGTGATAPSSAETSTFTTSEKSTSTGASTALAVSPTVRVGSAADGSGTMTASPTLVLAGSTGNTLTFTYTAAAGGLSSGEIDVAMPVDWSAPSTTGTDVGYATSTCGTVAVVSSPTIAVTGVTLASGATCTIVYGSKAAGGLGSTAPPSAETSTFTTTERSTSTGALTAVAVSPTVTVSNAGDGSGTMTVSPTSVVASSMGKTLTFTYTAPTGGLFSGEIDVAVPAGWSASSTTTNAPGYTTSTCGSVAAPVSAVKVTAVTLTSGATCTITYGSKASAGPGATAPPTARTSPFATTEKSTSSGALTPLAVSPSVTVTAAPPFFTLRPGAATDIAAGGTAIWAVGTANVSGGHPVYRWTGSAWSLVGGGAVTIAVGPDGSPWIVDSLHRIFHRSGNSWIAIPGAATDIAVGANGSVWAIGTAAVSGGHPIFHRISNTWSLVGGGAVTIAVGPDGIPWVLNSTHHIFHRSGTSWTSYPGLATDIAVGANGSVWITGAGAVSGGYGIFHRTSSGWAQVPGGAVTIAVTPTGNPWIINSTHAIYSH